MYCRSGNEGFRLDSLVVVEVVEVVVAFGFGGAFRLHERVEKKKKTEEDGKEAQGGDLGCSYA